MNEQEYLLSCVAEECVEIAQRATKAQRFGLLEIQPGQNSSNIGRIMQEFNDLIGVLEMLIGIDDISIVISRKEIENKKIRVRQFMEYSKQVGTLQGV